MKYVWFTLLLLFLVSCTPMQEVQINGVLTEEAENTSHRNEESVAVEEELVLEVINTTEETDMTESVTVVAPVRQKTRVEILGVNVDEDRCGVKVNDEIAWIDEGSNAVVGGIKIWVLDAFLLHAEEDAGVCEVIIGGTTFELLG